MLNILAWTTIIIVIGGFIGLVIWETIKDLKEGGKFWNSAAGDVLKPILAISGIIWFAIAFITVIKTLIL